LAEQEIAARTLGRAPPQIVSGADDAQLHFAPAMPPLIQSIALTPGGGLTHSAGEF